MNTIIATLHFTSGPGEWDGNNSEIFKTVDSLGFEVSGLAVKRQDRKTVLKVEVSLGYDSERLPLTNEDEVAEHVCRLLDFDHRLHVLVNADETAFAPVDPEDERLEAAGRAREANLF